MSENPQDDILIPREDAKLKTILTAEIGEVLPDSRLGDDYLEAAKRGIIRIQIYVPNVSAIPVNFIGSFTFKEENLLCEIREFKRVADGWQRIK